MWGCAKLLSYDLGVGYTAGADALGVYGMNLLSPVLPVGSRLANQHWTGVWFTHVLDPTGGSQSFEGLNFPGAGGLVLEAVLIGLMVVALRIALPDARSCAALGAAHPGLPGSHGLGGRMDRLVRPLDRRVAAEAAR